MECDFPFFKSYCSLDVNKSLKQGRQGKVVANVLERVVVPAVSAVEVNKGTYADIENLQMIIIWLVFYPQFFIVAYQDAADNVIEEHVGYDSRDVAPMC